MNCPTCGAENEADAHFCAECGAPLETQDSAPVEDDDLTIMSTVSEVSALGLVQMTRKRTRESLEHVLCESCPTCGGRGTVKTPETVAFEIFREILRESRQFETQTFLVMTSQSVVDLMLDEESGSVAELESFIGKSIKFQVETQYSQEHFDVVLM